MKNLKLAVQKKGRLSKKSLSLLNACGFIFENYSERLLVSAQNFALDILFIRDDDIPEYIQDGVADIGIVGENLFLEKERDVELIERLGFGKCRLSIAVPKQFNYNSLKDLNDKNISTTFPVILEKYLSDKGINASIHKISGSVEITPSINLADAVFDIVSTGSTLISNGLKEVEKVIDSEAVLIANKNVKSYKKKLLEKLLFRIRAVNNAQNYKYILLNAPNKSISEISQILPGLKSPTVMPLASKGWSSIHTVIKEDEFWENIENLKNAGAQGILVLPIEKMIA